MTEFSILGELSFKVFYACALYIRFYYVDI